MSNVFLRDKIQLGQSNKHSLELEKLIFSVLKEQKNSKKKSKTLIHCHEDIDKKKTKQENTVRFIYLEEGILCHWLAKGQFLSIHLLRY